MSPRPAVLASAVLACALLAAAGCGRATPEKLLRDAARDMEAGRIEAAAGKLERALAAEAFLEFCCNLFFHTVDY